jgi:serine O-acetyltransferase
MKQLTLLSTYQARNERAPNELRSMEPHSRNLGPLAGRTSRYQGADMATSGLLTLIRSDIDRYSFLFEVDGTATISMRLKFVATARSLLLCQGLQATIVHRIGHALCEWRPAGVGGRIVRILARTAHFASSRLVETITGISIADRASIGPGLYIGHFGGVIIGAATVGENCNLSHGVTIGRSGRIGQFGRPTLGDRVWIGPGAVITGAVTIGEDAVVGANAVVTKSVPARAAALGVPARVIADRPSFEMVAFRDSANDSGRARSMRALHDGAAAPRLRAI